MNQFIFCCFLVLGAAPMQAASSMKPALQSARSLISRELGILDITQDTEEFSGVAGKAFVTNSDQDDFYARFYRRGAVVINVYGPEDTGSRTISLKLCAVKKEDRVADMLCIYDITDPGDIFYQQFETRSALEQISRLDGRIPNRKEYSLKIFSSGNDWIITFGRPGNESQISTSLCRLRRLRAQQALDEGYPIEINGEKFIELAQRTVDSSLLYFGGDLGERIDYQETFYMEPRLMANINRSKNENVPQPSPLGLIGNQYYFLVFDPETGYWNPKPGYDPQKP